MMITSRKYRFYAAHRNHLLNDKCASLHGHTYRVEVFIEAAIKSKGIGILFSDIDKEVEPIIKAFDHSTLMWNQDPLYPYMMRFMQETENHGMKIVVFEEPTSLENVAKALFREISGRIPEFIKIEVQETESSTITYFE